MPTINQLQIEFTNVNQPPVPAPGLASGQVFVHPLAVQPGVSAGMYLTISAGSSLAYVHLANLHPEIPGMIDPQEPLPARLFDVFDDKALVRIVAAKLSVVGSL